MHVARGFAVDFDGAHNNLVTLLGLLERQHPHPAVAHPGKRELFAKGTRMFGTLKGNQRIIQTIRLPVRLSFSPISGVSDETKQNVVMAKILRSLIGIAAAGSWSSDEG